MDIEFYSNGKLLLTGEYVVLDGATALALPTRFGQSLRVVENDSKQLKWCSFEGDSKWFELVLEIPDLTVVNIEPSDIETKKICDRLIDILRTINTLNPNFLRSGKGYDISTHMDFNRQWGLGTSSTLINNLALWAGVDPYKLLALTFGGSGYDIACASKDGPILYERSNSIPQTRRVQFDPSFKEKLFFVYLNKKQDSRAGIEAYRSKEFNRDKLMTEVSDISRQLVDCDDHDKFQEYLQLHEDLISQALELPKVQDVLFPDYPGKIKSLGAWGGDFVLATGSTGTTEYFMNKGYQTVIPYSEMVL